MLISKKKFTNIILVFSILFIIFTSDSSMWFSASNNKLIILITIYFYTFISILIFYKLKKKCDIKASITFLALIILMSILLSMLVNNDLSDPNILVISSVIISMLYTYFMDKKIFIITYVYFIIFISMYSLIIMWIIVPYGNGIKLFFPSFYNEAGILIRNYIFTFHFEEHIGGMKRNTGLFREMGVFQHFINIAIMFLLYSNYFHKYKLFYFIILFITVITTYSSTGYLFLLLILISTIFSKGNLLFNNKYIYCFIALIVLILSLQLVNSNENNKVINTINKFSEGDSSYEGRIQSIISNSKVWVQSPVIGYGKERSDKLALENGLGNITEHNTSTTTSYFSFYGIIPGILFFYLLVNLAKSISQGVLTFIFIFAGLLISFNSQRFNFDILSTLLLFIPFMEEENNI